MTLRKHFFGQARVTVLLVLLAVASPALAGGGPENVFLVVNSTSWASQTVANHFIELRQIPSSNVFYIDWTGGFEIIEGETLRDKILTPVLDAIDRRGLLSQIDYIIYSSDFPYAADLSKELSRAKFIDQATPICSLNSATYLWNLVLARAPILMDFQINHYMRAFGSRSTEEPTRGFHSWVGWGNSGELLEAGGQNYMLSTMLAVTSGRGNSVREAVAYLERSATADGTHPKHTIYFSKTGDVRSTSRAPEFPAAVEALDKLNVRAHVTTEVMPISRSDVAGAMIGIANFSWTQSHSKILPGAICENFTSFGGKMVEDSSQTPLSEFLRYGAAGTSGTVVEPYAMPEKFPSPMMQVHYARGCTLAEAYYQSVFSPAQLLIVGDPLCRPWADIPTVRASGVKPKDRVSGVLSISPQASVANGGKVDHFELFVDGRRQASAREKETLDWNTKGDADGYHELRVVAVAAGPIETQGRTIIPVTVDNQGGGVELSVAQADAARWDTAVTVRVKAVKAAQIFVVHNNRILGRVAGAEGEVKFNPRLLGTGPVSLQAIAAQGPGKLGFISAPVSLTIKPSAPLPALKDVPSRLVKGLALTLPKDKVVTVEETRNAAWPVAAGLGPNEPFTLQGFFDVKIEDVYQFQVWHLADLKLSVDGVVLYSSLRGDYTQKFVPVVLARGQHRLTVSGTSASDVKLRLLFGGPGSLSLSGSTFRHQGK